MDEISFYSGDDRCTAWHFAATGEAFAGENGRPCVVMAPGFASTRDTGGLVAYAEGFAAAGLHAVLFDYRGFAASGGSPRQLVSASRQRQDYHAAIAAARRLPGVDPERIVLWGISFSGGHVLRVAAEDGRVAAVMSVTPAVDGVAVLAQLAHNAGVLQLFRVATHGLRDALRGLTGRSPHLVPVLGEPASTDHRHTARSSLCPILSLTGATNLPRTMLGQAFNRPTSSPHMSPARSRSTRHRQHRLPARPRPANRRHRPPRGAPPNPIDHLDAEPARAATCPGRSAGLPLPPSGVHRVPPGRDHRHRLEPRMKIKK